MSIAPQKIQSLAERAVFITPPPPLPHPPLYTSQGKVITINEFICICLSLLFVKLTTKQILTNVISTKIKVHFCCFVGCYWLSSLNEESFLPDKFREMTKQTNAAFFDNDSIKQLTTGVITHAGCWKNTRKVCKSRAEGE